MGRAGAVQPREGANDFPRRHTGSVGFTTDFMGVLGGAKPPPKTPEYLSPLPRREGTRASRAQGWVITPLFGNLSRLTALRRIMHGTHRRSPAQKESSYHPARITPPAGLSFNQVWIPRGSASVIHTSRSILQQ